MKTFLEFLKLKEAGNLWGTTIFQRANAKPFYNKVYGGGAGGITPSQMKKMKKKMKRK